MPIRVFARPHDFMDPEAMTTQAEDSRRVSRRLEQIKLQEQVLAAIAREEVVRAVAARRTAELAALKTASVLRRLDRSVRKLNFGAS